MIKQLTLSKYLLSLFLILVFAIILVGSMAKHQKENLELRIKRKCETTRNFYAMYKHDKGFNANLDQVDGMGMYKGRGFSFDVYEYSNFEPYQILRKSYTVENITYLKPQYKTEQYYDVGKIEYDQWGIPHIVGAGYKEKLVKIDDSPPNVIFQLAWDYYKNEMKSINAELSYDHFMDDVCNKYYALTISSDESFISHNKFGNEYFQVNVNCGVAYRYEPAFVWGSILNSIVYYFLLISFIPTMILAYIHYRKMRFFIIWCMVNYCLLVLSFSDELMFNKYYCLSPASLKIVWPFTKTILDMREKTIFLGNDNENGGSVSTYTGEKYLHAINPLSGYDFSDFLLYCFIGYGIHILCFKKK